MALAAFEEGTNDQAIVLNRIDSALKDLKDVRFVIRKNKTPQDYRYDNDKIRGKILTTTKPQGEDSNDLRA